MCGIVGIVDPNLPSNLFWAVVQRMTDSLIHQGPDDEGFFVADTVGLGTLQRTRPAGNPEPVRAL
jgi:asparagine synthase (glutamine-hydrolysing)